MCGIAGYVSIKRIIDHKKFEDMVDMVAYRGPNDRGIFFDEKIAMGQRRLSIIDVSSDGHQPFFYKDRYVLIYNGEIYNYIELREQLIGLGYEFHTKTDTEVLIAMYDRYGKACVSYFNGMWAFSIYDKEKNEIFCSRDRFGVKPLYYYYDNEQFIWASEIKQILSVWGNKAYANKKKLLEFLMFTDLDFDSETLFQDIYQLEPGYNLLYNVSNHKYSVNRYYDFSTEIQKHKIGKYEEEVTKFYDLFADSIKIRLRSDVPVGYCLSGGLDSSAIVCTSDKIANGNDFDKIKIKTITSCSNDKRYDEQEYADEVIEATKAEVHKIYPQGSNVFDDADEIIWHMDEPYGSTSIYAGWEVFNKAKEENLTVMLDGQGADEQLAGYSNFYSVLFIDLIKKGQFVKFFNELKAYKKTRAVTEKHISVRNIVLLPIIAAFMPKPMYKALRSSFDKANQNMPFSQSDYEMVLKDRNIYSFRDSNKFVIDSMQKGLCALLHYEDRNSMAFSIETRLPFLDYRLVEQVCKMPITYKIRNGMTKAVLRDSMSGILPEKVRNRTSKFGFVTPENQWINDNFELYRNELKKSCERLSGIVDENLVLKWFDNKQGKMKRGDSLAWRIICAGHWADIFDVNIV